MKILFLGVLSGVLLYLGWLMIGHLSGSFKSKIRNKMASNIYDIGLRITIPIFVGIFFILAPIEVLMRMNQGQSLLEKDVIIFLILEIAIAVSINYSIKIIKKYK